MKTKLQDLIELQVDAGIADSRALSWSRFDADPDSWTTELANLVIVLSGSTTRYCVALQYTEDRCIARELHEADSLAEGLMLATRWAYERKARLDALESECG